MAVISLVYLQQMESKGSSLYRLGSFHVLLWSFSGTILSNVIDLEFILINVTLGFYSQLNVRGKYKQEEESVFIS